jgi:uncharacterized protein (TIGR03067 family)
MDKELAKLQGTWTIAALEVNGQKMSAGMLAAASIVVQGDHFTSLGMGATYEGTLSLDPARKPKAFDLKFTAGPEKGHTSLGIYALDGATWKLCLTVSGKSRPKKFATSPGSGLALETLHRAAAGAKSAKKAPSASKAKASPPAEAADPNFVPAPELDGEWAMVSCVMNGQALPQAFVKSGRRVSKGGAMQVLVSGQTMMTAQVSVNRSTQPMSMDYVCAAGPATGQRQHGIYALDGDSLKICFAALGDPRPTEFSSSTGDARTFAVWRRLK